MGLFIVGCISAWVSASHAMKEICVLNGATTRTDIQNLIYLCALRVHYIFLYRQLWYHFHVASMRFVCPTILSFFFPLKPSTHQFVLFQGHGASFYWDIVWFRAPCNFNFCFHFFFLHKLKDCGQYRFVISSLDPASFWYHSILCLLSHSCYFCRCRSGDAITLVLWLRRVPAQVVFLCLFDVRYCLSLQFSLLSIVIT